MKKSLAVLCLFAVTMVTQEAFAEGFYGEIDAGASLPQDTNLTFANGTGKFELDNNYAIQGELGYHINQWMRAEAEIGHTSSGLGNGQIAGTALNGDGDSVSVTSYMANAILDLPNKSAFTPYLGFGLGAANVGSSTSSSNSIQSNDSDTVFAWQVKAGTAYRLSDHLSATLGWKYFQAEDATLKVGIPALSITNATMKASYATNEVLAGLRLDF